MNLSNFDLRRVLSAVDLLASDHEPASLPNRTFDSVKSLTSTDVVSFEGFGTDNYYQGPLWYAPVEAVSNEMLAAMGEYVSDHPCFDGIAAQRLQKTVKVSDYLSLPKFKRTTIYNEFFRGLGTDRQIVAGLHISAELTVTCSLCRLGKDYTDRDCRMFDLLTPHLTAAFRHARFINRLKAEAEQLQAALECAKLAVVTINRKSHALIENAAAAKLLSKYFQSDSPALPDGLLRYVNYHRTSFADKEFYFPPVPLVKKLKSEKLVVRLHFHSISGAAVLFLEEFSDPSIVNFAGLGLTNRENEVLFRVSQGKTDGEIAKILKISVRTVQKHLENIFNKLGVETRTSAASKILQAA